MSIKLKAIARLETASKTGVVTKWMLAFNRKLGRLGIKFAPKQVGYEAKIVSPGPSNMDAFTDALEDLDWAPLYMVKKGAARDDTVWAYDETADIFIPVIKISPDSVTLYAGTR